MPPLIECIRVPNFKLTPQGCSKLYYTAHKSAHSSQDVTLAAHEHCRGCPQGKKNYAKYGKKIIKERQVESKICALYEIAPYKCKGNTNGVFYRDWLLIDSQWQKKRFCTPRCGVTYNQMVAKGLIK